jgi:hypothetical protein
MHAGVRPPFTVLGGSVTYRGWVAIGPSDRARWSPPATGEVVTWGTPRAGRAPMRSNLGTGPWPADSFWVEIPLQIFATGPITIPGVEFTVEGPGSPLRRGQLPAIHIGVEPRVGAGDSTADLRPPRGPLAAPWWERVPWTWVFAGGVLLALAIALVRRLRKKRSMPARTPAIAAARRRDPAAEALADLAALRRMGLLDQGKFDEHALRLSRILRRYLEATRGGLRPGDSTTELLRRLQAAATGGEDVERLRTLLRRWDGIKFARLESDVEEGQRCEEAVRDLVVRGARSAEKEVA